MSYKPKKEVETKTDWKVVRALWNKSFSRSDFRTLVSFHSLEVGNTDEAIAWSAQELHPSEIDFKFIGNKIADGQSIRKRDRI